MTMTCFNEGNIHFIYVNLTELKSLLSHCRLNPLFSEREEGVMKRWYVGNRLVAQQTLAKPHGQWVATSNISCGCDLD